MSRSGIEPETIRDNAKLERSEARRADTASAGVEGPGYDRFLRPGRRPGLQFGFGHFLTGGYHHRQRMYQPSGLKPVTIRDNAKLERFEVWGSVIF